MWEDFGSTRKPGGFQDRRFNNNRDAMPWSTNDPNRPKLCFTMKTLHKGRGRGRPLTSAIRRIPNENLLMSVGSDDDSQPRIVRAVRTRWSSPLFSRAITESNSSKRYAAGNPSHGYKITISSSRPCEKEFLLNSLHILTTPDTFVPIMYEQKDHFAWFYVDEQKISEKLDNCDRTISDIAGFNMRVRVKPGFPRYELDDTLKERMANAIASKYLPEQHALDLSRFHLNPHLVDDYYCSLTRVPILTVALRILINALPSLVEISLDNNQIYSLDKLSLLAKLPNLKILGICDNKIDDMDQLHALQCLNLEELRMAGNPVSRKYNGRDREFFSDVQKIFPDLLRLDGVAMPRGIGFDLTSEQGAVPASQNFFSPNDQAREIATGFFYEYFRVFDSEDRQLLLNAYDELACFSMVVSLLRLKNMPETYVPNSRNLIKVVDDTRRRKMLKQGRLSVVACISELPRVQHDLSSFTMDICLVTEAMMLVTMTGIFREIETASQPIRYFTRTFIITPKGTGYCIINDMVHITRATRTQVKEAFRSTTTTEMTATTSAPAAIELDDDARAQMISALRDRTKMTLEWTLKCLNDVRWNFDTALAAFQECQARGAIPSEAFEQ